MATTSSPYDLEGATSYFPIAAGPSRTSSLAERRPSKKLFVGILFSSFLLLSSILLIISQRTGSQTKLNNTSTSVDHEPSTSIDNPSPFRPLVEPPSRGVSQGVSEKVFRRVRGGGSAFSWNNVMLSWQRTAFHFQPQKNWMNGRCAAYAYFSYVNYYFFFSLFFYFCLIIYKSFS